MKKVFLGLLVGSALGAVGAVGLMKNPDIAGLLKPSDADEEQQAQAAAEESYLQEAPNGLVAVKLDAETQVRMGLKVASLQAAQAPSEAKGFGRVLDPAPLAALVAEGASAQAALQASTKEYERIHMLYLQQQNASARALEAAEAALVKDRIQVESIRSHLLLDWGKAIASRDDLPAFVRSLVMQETALTRVDMSPGEEPNASPTAGRIAPARNPENMVEAHLLGPAPTADPQLQTRGFLFLAQADLLPPGTALTARLALPGRTRTGVVVPRDALLRHEGETFVYTQTGDDRFQRQAVTPEQSVGEGWFIEKGLRPQEKVVVVGAQQLLSEELKGQGGEEE